MYSRQFKHQNTKAPEHQSTKALNGCAGVYEAVNVDDAVGDVGDVGDEAVGDVGDEAVSDEAVGDEAVGDEAVEAAGVVGVE